MVGFVIYEVIMNNLLRPGTQAPEFKLRVTPDQELSLKDLRGKNVILAFYPADWSPVCSDEMAVFNELIEEFNKYNAQLIGISVDGPWSHAAFAKQSQFHFPLLADTEPKGDVAKKYGVYNEQLGVCERALFVIDSQGIIAWSYLSPMGENPGAEGILEALEDLELKKAA